MPCQPALPRGDYILLVVPYSMDVPAGSAMIVGVCQLHLHLHEVASLKEKRRVVRSLIDRTKARFNVAVAEVDHQDVWGTAVIGISCLSTDTRHATQVLDAVIRFIGDLPLEMEIMDCDVSYLPYP